MRSFNYSTLIRMIFFLMVASLVGCGGGRSMEPAPVETKSKGGGFQAALPKAGTRVVVWGNHSVAVDQASLWFYQHDFVMIDRTRLEQGLRAQNVRLAGSSRDWFKILEAGKQIGADFVTFVEVHNIHAGRKFELHEVEAAPDFRINVEVRSIKADTGEIISKGRASQLLEDEQLDELIESLTTQALQWAWTERRKSKEVQTPAEKPPKIDKMGSSPALSPRPVSVQEETESPELIEPPSETSLEGYTDTARSGSKKNSKTSEPVVVKSQKESSLSTEGVFANRQEFEPISSSDAHSQDSGIGLKVASGALTVLYFPVKVLYAGIGAFGGGVAYIFTGGNQRIADALWVASLEGTYVITPDHLEGKEPVYFRGVAEQEPANDQSPQGSILVQSP